MSKIKVSVGWVPSGGRRLSVPGQRSVPGLTPGFWGLVLLFFRPTTLTSASASTGPSCVPVSVPVPLLERTPAIGLKDH